MYLHKSVVSADRKSSRDDERTKDPRSMYLDVLTRRLSMRVLKCNKGTWWMPWQQEAMKDVAPCEKLRGDGSIL
jgi:hypothetical protein